MATLAEKKARIEELERRVAVGVARVTAGSRTVQYREYRDDAAALHYLKREVAAEEGTKPLRQIRTYATKGT